MKSKLLSTISLSVLSISPAFAVVDGTPVDWDKANNKVEMNCTGEILAGKWILSAAHCTWETAGGLRDVTFSPAYRDENAENHTKQQLLHPDYETDGPDISLWELSKPAAYNTISLLSSSEPAIGDKVELHGFGIDKTLKSATLESIDRGSKPFNMFMKDIGLGHSEPGDSGGPIFDTTGSIVGINSGDTGGGEFVGSYINSAQDFILSTVDNWHFPTRIDTENGTAVFTVQSLHLNNVSDTAYTDGDVTITGGTCVGRSVLTPFESCTYEVESTGKEGTVILSDKAEVKINNIFELPDNGGDNGGSSGGSGGSMGGIGLVLLGLVSAFRRRR